MKSGNRVLSIEDLLRLKIPLLFWTFGRCLTLSSTNLTIYGGALTLSGTFVLSWSRLAAAAAAIIVTLAEVVMVVPVLGVAAEEDAAVADMIQQISIDGANAGRKAECGGFGSWWWRILIKNECHHLHKIIQSRGERRKKGKVRVLVTLK